MADTRIHILFEFKEGPWGGGNQFLKSLKGYLQSAGVYEEQLAKADVILFNSYLKIDEAARIKVNHPGKCFVHRVDGPIRLYNRMTDRRDNVTNIASHLIADGTVFQSQWSREHNIRLGFRQNGFETVITNAPDAAVFNRLGKIPFSTERKVRLIATNWSPNWKKGFDVYRWLDENLDFNKYDLVLVGRSPIRFKNIRRVHPMASTALADELRKSDIFVFASPIEACSNSLLEALHCGLPAVGVNRSSTPELIGEGGEIFDHPDEIPQLLEKIADNYEQYQADISNPSIDDVGKQYYDFMSCIYQKTHSDSREVKHFGPLSYARVMATIYRWRITERIDSICERVRGAT